MGEIELVTEEAEKLIQYISGMIRHKNVPIDENTPLVSSGLIDSMGLLALLVRLEELTQMRIPPGKVRPKDLDTVALMFATAQRIGKPKK